MLIEECRYPEAHDLVSKDKTFYPLKIPVS